MYKQQNLKSHQTYIKTSQQTTLDKILKEYNILEKIVSKNYLYYKVVIEYKIYFIKNLIIENDYKHKKLLQNELIIYEMLKNIENIPKIIISDIEKGYIIYEYIDGIILSKIKNLTLKDKINILINLCEVLEEFHQHNIAHCDIKPSNILIDKNKKLYLIDLGICTKFGEICSHGSIKYCSIEQLTKKEVNPNFDIYAVGVIMYELILGYNPFQDIKKEQLISYKKKLSTTIEQLNTSNEIKKIMYKATTNNSDKYLNIKELKEELNNLNIYGGK